MGRSVKAKLNSLWVTYGSPFGGEVVHTPHCKHGPMDSHGRWLVRAAIGAHMADCGHCGGRA